MKECPRDYHLGYIVKKSWPFAARFKDTLLRLFEGGPNELLGYRTGT